MQYMSTVASLLGKASRNPLFPGLAPGPKSLRKPSCFPGKALANEMLRLASVLPLGTLYLGSLRMSFATQPLQDYSLALKKASEVGREEHDAPVAKEIGLCSGVPAEVLKRPARIFVSARSPSQQGFGKTLHDSSYGPQWRIAFDTTAKWENQLMGWTSTADPLENVGRASLFFYSKEEAIDFCNKYGWEYSVDTPFVRKAVRPKRFNGYGDNFSTKRAGLPDTSYLNSRSNY